jgi:hypothetical protein
MNRHLRTIAICALLVGLSVPALAVDNLLVDPGFQGPPPGNAWGNWGNTDFNNFWGPDVHASMYADWVGNYGGFFQMGIAGQPATSYQFTLFNTRIESHWDADLYFGLEYYDAADGTKLGETMVLADTAARVANGQVDGNILSMQGTSAAGTVFVRPIFRFDNINENYVAEPSANAFVFDTFLSLTPTVGQEFLKNAGFEDLNGDAAYGDYWGHWGTVDFNSFWGVNGHASFYADTVGSSGGVYQQGILGRPGARYAFGLLDVRIEQDWDADLYFGLQFYGDDDFHMLSETMVLADTSQPGDGLQFGMTSTAPPGTVYVRPLFRFDNVGHSGGSLRNAFVFTAGLTEAPGICRGDMNCDGRVTFTDIDPFVAALGGESAWNVSHPNCPWLNADCNGSGTVTFADIDPFVAVIGTTCP